MSTWLRRLLILLVLPAALHAQLRGIVRDGPTGAPIGGAVVAVLDASGGTSARTITNADGRFSVARDPKAVGIRVIKIGYKPRESPLPAAGAVLELSMDRIPPMLATVRVTGRELCPGSEDRSGAFQLWDQARAGLLATVVARELKPAMAKSVVYESHLTPNDERVRAQSKRITAGRTKRPFVAAESPGYFARNGYVIDDPSARLYRAPDEDVLLDESFATTHCFRVQAADEAHRGQIGLAFSPAPGRDTLTDVSGVIWIDGAEPQLKSLEFLYTALEPPAMAAKAGGHIEFRTMPNGVAFVVRWSLRLPELEVIPITGAVSRSTANPLQRIRRWDRTDLRIRDIVETGGIVIDATWADSTAFHDTPSIVNGTVTQRKTNAPLANALVTLVGTPDTVLTNSAGQFEITAIPGKYNLAVADTTLRSYVQSRAVSQPVEVLLGRTTTTHLELAPLGDVIKDVCHGIPVYDREVLLLGHVFAPDRKRIQNATVTGTWSSYYIVGGTIATRTTGRDSDVDDDGRFVVCGAPVEQAVKMRLSVGKNVLADTTLMIDKAAAVILPVEWRIPPLGSRP